ncbi:radial spoke head 10 homolog B-like [Olea europaea subsp. europaea]|uniref:Radial spoke head 10 homolog B-like n=1 Tax=Olea europaea subsp. europaea TaxID=158383 RepID=A0A8S0RWB9_OLEEU|nr:radial spoke head 10 homolog B-like [Olea europaea subsp. europaea]
MEGHKSQAKLTRTQSSLLRSSPTIRSSIHSFSSVCEITPDREIEDLEEQKPHGKPSWPLVRPCSRSGLAPFVAVLLLSVYTIFAFFNRDDIPTSENLLLVLIFVAVFLFFASKNMALIHQNFNIFKQSCDEYAKRVGLSCFTSKHHSKPVQWFIGEPDLGKKGSKKEYAKKIIREGVQFYSNGDFYEGEFHKGRCNGSGVYNYFVNGRYEGDWIDGRYDGYGIESWAKGSRYRGQYRQGLRHGYGVYKFYTGDSYAGEWCNGQSHGVGAQTCADGSCYIGEFKCGVKHGFGCYHFRNGDRYAGEYFGDKIHGFGVYHFANGHCYEGSWHEGRKQGYGMYTFRSGETRSGEWNSGNLKIPLPPLTDTVLQAVQVTTPTFNSYLARSLCSIRLDWIETVCPDSLFSPS